MTKIENTHISDACFDEILEQVNQINREITDIKKNIGKSFDKKVKNDKILNNSNKSKREIIRLAYQNCRGIGTKEKKIHSAALSCDYEIIVMTETWLKEKHKTSAFFTDKFNVFRRDRSELRVNGTEIKNGGGLIVAVAATMPSEQIDLNYSGHSEYLCVRIKLAKSNLLVYALYIPPQSKEGVYNAHIELIRKIPMDENDILIIVGDFNLANVHWLNDDDSANTYIPVNFPSSVAYNVLLQLQSEGLLQLNDLVNKAGNVLDLFFINEPVLATLCSEYCPISQPVDEAHPPFTVKMELECTFCPEMPRNEWVYSFKNANFDGICDYIDLFDFTDLFANKMTDERLDILYGKLTEACENCVRKVRALSEKKIPMGKR